LPDPDSTLTINYSLIGVADGLTITGNVGNLTGTTASPLDPLLGPLQNNGGPTETHALLPTSPAIDVGDPSFVSLPNYDQRGFAFERIVGGRIDIGAFESESDAASADFDSDGDVDGADFLTWQRGFGTMPVVHAEGDANVDAVVDVVDLAVWQNLFGTSEAPPLVAGVVGSGQSAVGSAALIDAALALEWLGSVTGEDVTFVAEEEFPIETALTASAFGNCLTC